MISKETVKEFQEVFQTEYSIKLSEKEAQEMLANLVGYFDVLAQINHQDKLDTRGNQ